VIFWAPENSLPNKVPPARRLGSGVFSLLADTLSVRPMFSVLPEDKSVFPVFL